MILVITIIMITVQTTPTIAPIKAPLLLLLSQGSQAIVHSYKTIMHASMHIHTYVATC